MLNCMECVAAGFICMRRYTAIVLVSVLNTRQDDNF